MTAGTIRQMSKVSQGFRLTLVEARKARGLSQNQLAAAAGVGWRGHGVTSS